MKIAGIICEYNPLHLGHKKQLDYLRSEGYAVVCLMSGNFVQRGHPAIFDKTHRAEAAVRCGADLVLELPLPYALSSAEGFAAGGVQILSRLCDKLCFGAETADADRLWSIAAALLSPAFSQKLRRHLDAGISFPAARQAALEEMGYDGEILASPNNILAVEYCKAILQQGSPMQILPIHRGGDYHDATADAENPSATALRMLLRKGEPWESFVPQVTVPLWKDASIHNLETGEAAILYRLRTMTEEDFSVLPYGSEGLWRKLMHASRKYATLEQIIAATKSKRYTRTRIDRMILCGALHLTQSDLTAPVPYCRVLSFNDTGRAILKQAKDSGYFINIGTDTGHPYQQMEQQATALYGLFSATPERADAEENYRVYYHKAPAPILDDSCAESTNLVKME